ncbi:alpha-L-rhamnosidase C-terminal domain-containing protein [Pedobacter sp.]|uniref:alpha-L-rhamnosidase-related protein n=1 Tax=Pedobacter sp. TaxID=1411316 RepID=UPI003D7FBE55
MIPGISKVIAQAFYAHSVQMLLNAATTLGKTEDIDRYSKLLPQIKDAFVKEFTTFNGALASSTQTAYVLALQFDLLPENMRQQAAQRLVDNIKEYKYHLTTGFVGTPYLCHVLTRFGFNDIAYRLLLQQTYPSWLFQVKQGATTIWERWDGIKADGTFQNIEMNSFNHYAYGAIGEWMYKNIAGIKADDSAPGYQHFYVAPLPGGKLSNAAASFESPYGKIASKWEIGDGVFTLSVTIPANTSATVTLPGAANQSIRLDGKSLPGSVENKQDGNNVVLKLGSGTYSFAYHYTL